MLEIRHATKRFGAVTALEDVSFSLYPGEILALLGDNGAGKSTLIKCLSGVYGLDSGQIWVDGQPFEAATPHAARARGIETVYQDLAVFDNLTAAENLFVGRETARPAWLGPFGFVQRARMHSAAREMLGRIEVGVKSARLPLGLMSGGQRQAIAVGRAEAFAQRIVVLDEPTAALGVRESRNVQEFIRSLPARGVAVLLVSHNLEQVISLAARAVVLRQGRKVGEMDATAANHERLVSLIVGGRQDQLPHGELL